MDPTYKECCRLFYMVKGHLNTSPETIRSSYNGYFKRLWYNNEAYTKEHREMVEALLDGDTDLLEELPS